MHVTKLALASAILASILLPLFAVIASAQTESVIFNFSDSKDGGPAGPLISDAAGNFYGTTFGGGSDFCQFGSCGTVFELSPLGNTWTHRVLYEFGGPDGAEPLGDLVFDTSGNLYGTTSAGGTNNCGVVFELSSAPGGTWTQKVLHTFTKIPDGCSPAGGLTLDAAGNLYGMTEYGGTEKSLGTVFELMPDPNGLWTEKILHTFGERPLDGANPWYSGLTFDSAGNLYGTTASGGAYAWAGTVFELTPMKSGLWSEKILHNFGRDYYKEAQPEGNLVIDARGNLYGMTTWGGYYSAGTVFELSPDPADGGWVETVAHNFGRDRTDGTSPQGPGLIMDADGNLYGTSTFGGIYDGGVAFKLSRTPGAVWVEDILHSFGKVPDASSPYSGMIFDSAGNLYGTTFAGGYQGSGAVFEIMHARVE